MQVCIQGASVGRYIEGAPVMNRQGTPMVSAIENHRTVSHCCHSRTQALLSHWYIRASKHLPASLANTSPWTSADLHQRRPVHNATIVSHLDIEGTDWFTEVSNTLTMLDKFSCYIVSVNKDCKQILCGVCSELYPLFIPRRMSTYYEILLNVYL